MFEFGVTTMKSCGLVADPELVVTCTGPDVAFNGTVAINSFTLASVTGTETPLTVTELLDAVVEKPPPSIANDEPAGPCVGAICVTIGAFAVIENEDEEETLCP